MVRQDRHQPVAGQQSWRDPRVERRDQAGHLPVVRVLSHGSSAGRSADGAGSQVCAEDEPLARFLTGRPVEFDLTWRLSRTRAEADAKRTTTTVRIVIEPPSLYTRFELAVYPQLVAAGEDVRIIAAQEGHRPPELPLHDFWLFDDRDVWKMHYYENFRFAGAELLDDPDVVAQHLRWRDIALARATPLHAYLASRAGPDDSETTTA